MVFLLRLTPDSSQQNSRAYQLLTPFIRCPSLSPKSFQDPDFSVEYSLLSREVQCPWGTAWVQVRITCWLESTRHLLWVMAARAREGICVKGPPQVGALQMGAFRLQLDTRCDQFWQEDRAPDLRLNSCRTNSEENDDTFNNSVHLPWKAQVSVISSQLFNMWLLLHFPSCCLSFDGFMPYSQNQALCLVTLSDVVQKAQENSWNGGIICSDAWIYRFVSVFNYGDSELMVMQSTVVVGEHVTEATNFKENGKQSERRCLGKHSVSDLHFPSKLHFLRIPL